MTKIQLNKDDIAAITATLDNFPNIDNFTLIYNNAAGIGYTIDIEIETAINGVPGKFISQTTDVSNW